jgi:hypothetical protein
MLLGSLTTPSGIGAAALGCATWTCGRASLWRHVVTVLFDCKFTGCT